jgi:ABC-type antimicrobial peptide transport system permease subunit
MNAQMAKSLFGPREPFRHALHFTPLLAASWQQYSAAPFLDTLDKLRQVLSAILSGTTELLIQLVFWHRVTPSTRAICPL